TDNGRRVDEAGRAHPTAAERDAPQDPAGPGGSGTGSTPTEPRQPTGFRRPTEPATPEQSASPGAPGTRETIGGLPRRIRQASLAPQLREDSAVRDPEPARTEPDQDFERDAEEVRSRMASLQRGWQRGRRQNAEDVTGPGETAQGTTPGGDGR
ncbi:histidine kinase, partial [Streptomyces sp. Wh19]|nr:histidine kinase [Streptomyces sp. Wh19]